MARVAKKSWPSLICHKSAVPSIWECFVFIMKANISPLLFFSLQAILASFFNLQITYTLPKPHMSPNCQRAPLRQEVQDLIHYPRYGYPPTECRELINISLLENVILCMPLKSAFFFVFISHVTLLIHIELKWHFYYKELLQQMYKIWNNTKKKIRSPICSPLKVNCCYLLSPFSINIYVCVCISSKLVFITRRKCYEDFPHIREFLLYYCP